MTSITQLIPLLTEGYEEKCRELGIIQRSRQIKTPADLMMLCLFHLCNGCSLMEISEVARILKIGNFSDVAFMKKFAKCGSWFEWVSMNLVKVMAVNYKPPMFLEDYRLIAFDASTVTEKGASGRTYRLHYGIDIFGMSNVGHKITTQDVGETLVNFELKAGDLVVADRAYGTLNGILHSLNSKADYILRLRANHFSIYNEEGKKIDIVSKVASLDYEESTEVMGFAKNGQEFIPVRVCIRRKSKTDCDKSKKKLLNRKTNKGFKSIRDTTIKFNEYIIVATSLPKNIPAESVLETYRLRWQVEILFKRLKSILNFGELPKKKEESSLAWLNGKLMVALLIEHFLGTSLFFPKDNFHQKHLERNQTD